jgi:hypothetical protein
MTLAGVSTRLKENGAEDGTRTRDPHLGKVMLYQLSHFRSMTALTGCWCREPDSNWRHRDFQSRALPTELSRPDTGGRVDRPFGALEDSTALAGPARTPESPRGPRPHGAAWRSGMPRGLASPRPATQSSPARTEISSCPRAGLPVSSRSRFTRSTIGGWVEKSPVARFSNFLIGFVK